MQFLVPNNGFSTNHYMFDSHRILFRIFKSRIINYSIGIKHHQVRIADAAGAALAAFITFITFITAIAVTFTFVPAVMVAMVRVGPRLGYAHLGLGSSPHTGVHLLEAL